MAVKLLSTHWLMIENVNHDDVHTMLPIDIYCQESGYIPVLSSVINYI